LAEEQIFRLGGSATFVRSFLLPVLADRRGSHAGPRYAVEILDDAAIERGLHELTLDFGVVTVETISRPLQLKAVGPWRLCLWVPKSLGGDESQVLQALKEQRLPLVVPSGEIALPGLAWVRACKPRLTCSSFLEAKAVLASEALAAFLPDFLPPEPQANRFWQARVPALNTAVFRYRLAWNPRLLRLNPHASRQRDFLLASLSMRMQAQPAAS
jgi:DNA-binding transcriptional LysR family regulator